MLTYIMLTLIACLNAPLMFALLALWGPADRLTSPVLSWMILWSCTGALGGRRPHTVVMTWAMATIAPSVRRAHAREHQVPAVSVVALRRREAVHRAAARVLLRLASSWAATRTGAWLNLWQRSRSHRQTADTLRVSIELEQLMAEMRRNPDETPSSKRSAGLARMGVGRATASRITPYRAWLPRHELAPDPARVVRRLPPV